MTSDIHVYGTDWCSLTFAVREYLMNSRLIYTFHDIDRDPEAERFVLAINEGRRRFPVIVIGEQTVTQPTVAELQRILEEEDTRPVERRTRKTG